MSSLINGIKTNIVGVKDRGLLYGQSLFETIAIDKGRPLLLGAHLQRLKHGCNVLSIKFDASQVIEEIEIAADSFDRGVVRVMLTMGEGGRGYRNPSDQETTRIISAFDYPDYPAKYWDRGVVLGLCEIRLARQPALAGIKHGNRLEQIIARAQWQPTWQEAIMLDHEGDVIECNKSNIFIRRGNQLFTPDIFYAGVAGVMREYVLNSASSLGFTAHVARMTTKDVHEADEVFVTNSLIGLWPVRRFQLTEYKDFNVSHRLLSMMQGDGAIPAL